LKRTGQTARAVRRLASQAWLANWINVGRAGRVPALAGPQEPASRR